MTDGVDFETIRQFGGFEMRALAYNVDSLTCKVTRLKLVAESKEWHIFDEAVKQGTRTTSIQEYRVSQVALEES